ncbi:MAG: HypC/HybG/HupF family hydrogenase formation chaperone [Methylococcales bacterium]|nr:HypC/HybG/HupF family hydrogenase formation chaperone [Methylococcales bacterium]
MPAKIISISKNDDKLQRMVRVHFSGVIKDISLAYLPKAKVNDYVIVHTGLALSILDEDKVRLPRLLN